MLKKILIILILLTVKASGRVYAEDLAQSMGLVVSPAIIDVSLERGKVYTRELTVKSTSSKVTGFVVTIENLVLSDYASLSDKELVPPDWIRAEHAEFILNPGEVRKLEIVFSPMKNTPPGGYYGTLYIQPVADLSHFTNEKTTSVPKLGVLLLSKIKGRVVQNLIFTGFNSNAISTNTESIVLNFENLGNVHSMPSGKVVITNIVTKNLQTIDLPPSLIFPNSSKELTLKFENKISQGIYTIDYLSSTKTYNTMLLVLTPAGILLTSVLTFLLCVITLYIRRYFMSKRHEEKL